VYTACNNQSDCLKFDKEITASHTLRTVKFLLNKCEETSCLYLQHLAEGNGEEVSPFANWISVLHIFMHLTEYSNTETEKQAKIHFDKIKQTHFNEDPDTCKKQTSLDMLKVMKIQVQLLERKLHLKKIYKVRMNELIINACEYLPYSSFFATKKKQHIPYTTFDFVRSAPKISYAKMTSQQLLRYTLIRLSSVTSSNFTSYSQYNLIKSVMHENPELRNNAVLWRVALLTHPRPHLVTNEVQVGCPWSKQLLVDVMRSLEESGGEVEEVLRRMKKCGVRLRTCKEEIDLLMSISNVDDIDSKNLF